MLNLKNAFIYNNSSYYFDLSKLLRDLKKEKTENSYISVTLDKNKNLIFSRKNLIFARKEVKNND